MNHSELVAKVAQTSGVARKDAAAVLAALIQETENALAGSPASAS